MTRLQKHYSRSSPLLSTGFCPQCTDFCILHKFILFTLYNITYCKMQKTVISYRHEEVIPMYT